jgi:hypothetical protein
LGAHQPSVADISIEASAASCALIAEKSAPILANYAVIGARLVRTSASGVLTCANIARTDARVLHRQNCALIVVKSGQTPEKFAAIDVSFAKMFAIGVETFVTSVMIGVMPAGIKTS